MINTLWNGFMFPNLISNNLILGVSYSLPGVWIYGTVVYSFTYIIYKYIGIQYVYSSFFTLTTFSNNYSYRNLFHYGRLLGFTQVPAAGVIPKGFNYWCFIIRGLELMSYKICGFARVDDTSIGVIVFSIIIALFLI